MRLKLNHASEIGTFIYIKYKRYTLIKGLRMKLSTLLSRKTRLLQYFLKPYGAKEKKKNIYDVRLKF
jgi:hypothetical protein